MNPINTICVIDDDMVYHFIIKKQIEHSRISKKVLTFPTGGMALEYFKSVADKPEQQPDVVLLDINMPVMDGWDFLAYYKTIKQQFSKPIYICMVSSSLSPEDREKANGMESVSDFIVKPVTDEKLQNLLYKAVLATDPRRLDS
jgi:CheY-like chemotaxis protein